MWDMPNNKVIVVKETPVTIIEVNQQDLFR
jgi:hypothetical protein